MFDGNGGIVMPFLDTLEKGITKAKDFGERNRLLGEINVREMHKKECLTALGEQYYDALKHKVTPDCSVLYRELQTVDQELRILQREMQKLSKTLVCPKCGVKLSAPCAFCPACGTKLQRKDVCRWCGAALDEGADYCVNCGQRTADSKDRSV